MRQGKFTILLSIAVMLLVGCASSSKEQVKQSETNAMKAEQAVIQEAPKKTKKLSINRDKKGKPSGYMNPQGPINAKGKQQRPLPKVAFSSTTDANKPERIYDNDFATRWSSKGKNAWIVLDYGKIMEFDAVRLSFYKGNERSSKFTLQLSKDGRDWVNVVENGVSSGQTTGYERFPFKPTRARYIKYIGFGNTQNMWSSLNEMNAVNCTLHTCLKKEFIIF